MINTLAILIITGSLAVFTGYALHQLFKDFKKFINGDR